MGALTWISELVSALGSLVPRIFHVPKTHNGVLFTRGHSTRMAPGMHWYWPIWSHPMVYPIKRQTVDLPAQTLMTADEKAVFVSATVVYQIEDIEKALVETYELEDTIRDTAMGAVRQAIVSASFDDLRTSQEVVDKDLTDFTRAALKEYGACVLKAFLVDFVPTKVLRCVGDPLPILKS